jgi:hypothetical protein
MHISNIYYAHLVLAICYNMSSLENRQSKLNPPMIQSRSMHSSYFINPNCKTQQKQESFCCRTISNWNWLPQEKEFNRLVEALKLVVSSSKDKSMTSVNSCNRFQFSCGASNTIVSLV